MDASQLTRIRRAVAVSTGPRPLFGFTESVDYTDAKFGTREVVFQGAIVKPCCTDISLPPLALTLTFDDFVPRSFSPFTVTVTDFKSMVAAYKNFTHSRTRSVEGGFLVFGTGYIVYADGTTVQFNDTYSPDSIPPGDVKFYGTVFAIIMGGPSLSAVSFNPASLTIFDGFALFESSVTSLDLTDLTTMTAVFIGTLPDEGGTSASNPYLETIDFTPCTNLIHLECNYNEALSSIVVHDLALLQDLEVFDNNLAGLDISGCTSLNHVLCYGNSLSQNVCDTIAAELVVYGVTGGTLTVNTQTDGDIDVNKVPYTTLITREWTVT